MDYLHPENKPCKDAVMKSVEKMCRVFWGADLASCKHMIENSFFHCFEMIGLEPGGESLVLLDQIKSITQSFNTHQSLYDHLNECHVRLFVNSREGIAAPLYESCYEYENAPMMGRPAEEMSRRFASRGLSMENRIHEPPDHLAVELEYLFFLLQEKDELISEEAAAFAGDIMLPWISIFNQRLKRGDENCRFYSLAAGILVLLLQQISNLDFMTAV